MYSLSFPLGMPGHHLYSPIRGLLCIGKFYDFRLYVAEAKQVHGSTKFEKFSKRPVASFTTFHDIR